MPDASEVVHYDEPGIPLYIRSGQLSTYPDMRANCHWHEDLEFIYVLSGEMRYSINGEIILLGEDDCLFVNARQMHYGYEHDFRECIFTCTLIHPDLLTGNRKLYERYVQPLLANGTVPYIHTSPESREHRRFADSLSRVWALKEESPVGYEADAVGILFSLTAFLSGMISEREDTFHADQKLEAQKKMVAFIAKHFADPISLEDVAASANLSKSSCIRLFKIYVHQSPFSFLNTYRLQVACDLLTRTDKNVTEISSLCGFNHTSYFTKLFHCKYGCTPTAYRKACKTR